MSPEKLLNYLDPDKTLGHSLGANCKMNMFSIGCIAFQMLCGNVPFNNKNPTDRLE